MAIEHPTIDFSAIDIRTLLPQQPPFVMVDNILSCDATTTRCSYTVPPDNIFCEGGVFTAPGLIEHVAQTAAARLGFINLYVNKADSVQVGYIGAIKDFEIVRLPHVGETIETDDTRFSTCYDWQRTYCYNKHENCASSCWYRT